MVIKNFLGPILHTSIGLLITKAKAKHFESNFQTTLKKSKLMAKIRLSRPPVITPVAKNRIVEVPELLTMHKIKSQGSK